MARIESLAEVDRVLGVLIERGYARRLERRPGQKEDRYEHLLGGATPVTAAPAVTGAPTAPTAPAPPAAWAPSAPAPLPGAPAANGELEARISALEDEVARLRDELDARR